MSTYWAILDQQGDVVGEWDGQAHLVTIYESKKEASEDAIALNIPNYQICRAAEALTRKPSKFST
jgi:hypothetical protein